MTVLTHGGEAAGLGFGYSVALVNMAWAPGQALGAAGGGALAHLTSNAVPYLLLAGVCALTLAGLWRAIDRLDDAIGSGIERAVVAHHRRRLTSHGWAARVRPAGTTASGARATRRRATATRSRCSSTARTRCPAWSGRSPRRASRCWLAGLGVHSGVPAVARRRNAARAARRRREARRRPRHRVGRRAAAALHAVAQAGARVARRGW